MGELITITSAYNLVSPGKKVKFEDRVPLDLLDESKGHAKYTIAHYHLKCVEEISPADGYELIIVPTNVHQTEEALQMLVHADAGGTIRV